MDSQNIIFQPNIQNSLILNNYLIQNFIVTPIKQQQYKKQILKEQNPFQIKNKMLYKTPKNKIVNKNYKPKFQNINIDNGISPMTSRKLIDDKKFNYNNLKTFLKEKDSQTKLFQNLKLGLFPKLINITTKNSKEKRPQDSVKKSKKSKNNLMKFEITHKNETKSSLSPNHLFNKEVKETLQNIPIKNTKLKNSLSEGNIKRLNKFPKDSKKVPKKLNLKEFIYGKKIGKGTYGNIYSVKWKINDKYYSLKKETLTDINSIKDRKNACKIIQNFIEKTDCQGIINIYCNLCYKVEIKDNTNFKTENNDNSNNNFRYEYFELMEKADKDWETEISERRKCYNFYTQKELLNIIFQLVTTLSTLQKNHITHRDIKPQNILILDGFYKLGDFGEIKQLKKDGLIVQRVRGSELYMSTILFNALHSNLALVKHNTYKSDVFSLGMCLFYAASLTYEGVDSIRELTDMNEIKNILFYYLGTRYSEKLILLIILMLEIDEKKRPNFIKLEEVLKLNFLSERTIFI